MQITLSCDIRVASDQAKFGFRENNIGLIPGAGGCSRLVKLIGYGKAKELIFTGEMIGAVEAERIGLVNRVVPHDELMSNTRALAEHLLTRAPEALGLAKRILWHSVTSDFATGRMLEALAQSILVKSKDHREGIRAFREKRKPEFKGASERLLTRRKNMALENVLIEKRGRVAIVTINRPDKLNALNIATRNEILAAFDQLASDDEVRVVIITGAGEKAFIAGADINEFAG